MVDLIPSGFGGTLLLMLVAAPIAWVYGFVAGIGYDKESGPFREELPISWLSAGVAVGCVFIVRHVFTGGFFDGMTTWHSQSLDDMGFFGFLFLGLPFTVLVMALFLALVVFFLAVGAAGVIGTLYLIPGFFMGLPRVWDWYFVKHPAEEIVAPALREGKELDAVGLRDALTPTPMDLEMKKPEYHYEHQAKKARAVAKQLNADAEIAHAAIERERAREAALEAERKYEEAKRRAQRQADL